MICISASMKYKEEIYAVSRRLQELGIEHCMPQVGDFAESEIPRLTHEHFSKIKNSDAILVVNPTGYIGDSVKTEIGYALGAGKKVYMLNKTGAIEFDGLVHGIVGDELERLRKLGGS